MKKNIFIIALLSMAVLCTGCSQILNRVAESQAKQAMEFRQELFQEDEINIVLCGTNAPVPNPDRAEACTAIFVNGEMLLFDAGDRALTSIGKLRLPVDKLSAIFVTHLHDDHIIEVGNVIHRSWMWGRANIVKVFGPKGTENVMDGFNKIYERDRIYRRDHHGVDIINPKYSYADTKDIVTPELNKLVTVYKNGDLTVSAYQAEHEPISPALGYRIEYKGKVIVISGDTTGEGSMAKYAKNADVLISELMNMEIMARAEKALLKVGKPRLAKLTKDIQDYHIGPEELGKIAQKANVKTLMLTHLVPGISGNRLLNNFMFKWPVAEHYDGEIIVGKDGTEHTIKLN